MELSILNNLLLGQPKYRSKQAYQAIFCDLISSWSEATTLPLDLRNKLEAEFSLTLKAKEFLSKDKSVKTLITLNDSQQIETVLLKHRDGHNTVCVSSQVGCPLGCLFCATGKMGFKRNLTVGEILMQILYFARYLKKENKKVTNVVFMGMGEPFLNYDNVMKAIRKINDKELFNIGARHISISTIGITEGIKKLANENLQVNLAISLHAPDDKLRKQIIPVGSKYPLAKILSSVDDYIKKTNRKVMFEYLLIKNFNDSEQQAVSLAKLMAKHLYHVNLLNYNPTGKYQPASHQAVAKFMNILKRNKVSVSLRHSFGQEIDAACGQLTIKNK